MNIPSCTNFPGGVSETLWGKVISYFGMPDLMRVREIDQKFKGLVDKNLSERNLDLSLNTQSNRTFTAKRIALMLTRPKRDKLTKKGFIGWLKRSVSNLKLSKSAEDKGLKPVQAAIAEDSDIETAIQDATAPGAELSDLISVIRFLESSTGGKFQKMIRTIFSSSACSVHKKGKHTTSDSLNALVNSIREGMERGIDESDEIPNGFKGKKDRISELQLYSNREVAVKLMGEEDLAVVEEFLASKQGEAFLKILSYQIKMRFCVNFGKERICRNFVASAIFYDK